MRRGALGFLMATVALDILALSVIWPVYPGLCFSRAHVPGAPFFIASLLVSELDWRFV